MKTEGGYREVNVKLASDSDTSDVSDVSDISSDSKDALRESISRDTCCAEPVEPMEPVEPVAVFVSVRGVAYTNSCGTTSFPKMSVVCISAIFADVSKSDKYSVVGVFRHMGHVISAEVVKLTKKDRLTFLITEPIHEWQKRCPQSVRHALDMGWEQRHTEQ